MDEPLRFIQGTRSDRFTMAELCARFGICRRVGYKRLARFEEECRRGLVDRSRAPHHCSHRIGDALAPVFAAVLAICDQQGLIGQEMFAIYGVKLPNDSPLIQSWPRPPNLTMSGGAKRRPLHAVVGPTTSPRLALRSSKQQIPAVCLLAEYPVLRFLLRHIRLECRRMFRVPYGKFRSSATDQLKMPRPFGGHPGGIQRLPIDQPESRRMSALEHSRFGR